MENIYLEGDQVILLSVVEQLHLPFLAGMYSKLFFIITGLGVGKGENLREAGLDVPTGQSISSKVL